MKKPASDLRSTAFADLNQDAIKRVPSQGEVATRAYFNYLNQGSQPGHDVRHWLEAEAQLFAESQLAPSPNPQTQDNFVCDAGIESGFASEDHRPDRSQIMPGSQELFRTCTLL